MTGLHRLGTLLVFVAAAVALGWATVTFGDAGPSWLRMTGLVVTGFLGGLGFPIAWRDDLRPGVLFGYAVGLILVAAVGLATTPAIGFLPSFLTVAFGVPAFVALAMALHRIWTAGESVRIESDWGGLGHGFGGWQISAPATLLLCAFIFGSMTVGAVVLHASRTTAAAVKEGSDKPKTVVGQAATPPAMGTR